MALNVNHLLSTRTLQGGLPDPAQEAGGGSRWHTVRARPPAALPLPASVAPLPCPPAPDPEGAFHSVPQTHLSALQPSSRTHCILSLTECLPGALAHAHAPGLAPAAASECPQCQEAATPTRPQGPTARGGQPSGLRPHVAHPAEWHPLHRYTGQNECLQVSFLGLQGRRPMCK